MTAWGPDWPSPVHRRPAGLRRPQVPTARRTTRTSTTRRSTADHPGGPIPEPEAAAKEWAELTTASSRRSTRLLPVVYSKQIQLFGSKLGGARYSNEHRATIDLNRAVSSSSNDRSTADPVGVRARRSAPPRPAILTTHRRFRRELRPPCFSSSSAGRPARVVILLLISAFTFFLFFAIPQDPAALACGKNCTPRRTSRSSTRTSASTSRSRRSTGTSWSGIFTGRDFAIGHCSAPVLRLLLRQLSDPVWDTILDRFPTTLSLTIGGSVVFLLVGLGTGMLAAWKRGTLLDKVFSSVPRWCSARCRSTSSARSCWPCWSTTPDCWTSPSTSRSRTIPSAGSSAC